MHAVRWHDGTLTDLGTLGTDSYAAAATETGDVAGTYGAADGNTRRYLWRNGVMADLTSVRGVVASVNDVNRARHDDRHALQLGCRRTRAHALSWHASVSERWYGAVF